MNKLATASLPEAGQHLEILELNERAVRLMRDGCYKDAIRLLQTSLRSLLSLINVESYQESTCSHAHFLQEYVVQEDDDRLGNTTMCESNLTPLAVYPSAFSISNQNDDPQEFADCFAKSVSAMLFYNIGLAYHLKSLSPRSRSPGASTDKLQNRALSMYNSASTLLDDDHGGSHLQLLKLAIYNNQCHIYSCLSDQRNVTACHDLLRLTLQAYQLQEPESINWVIFHLNLLVIKSNYAPAA